jgi:hypothetical protein
MTLSINNVDPTPKTNETLKQLKLGHYTKALGPQYVIMWYGFSVYVFNICSA